MPVTQSTIDAVITPGLTTDYTANRAALAKDQAARENLLPQIQQAQQAEADVRSKTAQEEAPVYGQLADFQPRQSQLPTPQAPQEYHKPELDPAQLKQAAGAMLVISGLVGAFSRQGWTGALNNMTAAMKGIQEGNEQQAKTAKEQYDAGVSHFKTQLEALKEDRLALDKMDQSDLGALRRQLEFIAHKNDAELIAAQAKTHSYTDTLAALDKHITSMEQAISKAQTAAASLQRSIDYHDRTTNRGTGLNAAGLSPAAIDQAAEQYRKTGQMPSLGMGNGPIRVQIMNRAAEQAAAAGESAAQTPAARAQFAANKTALVNNTKDLAAITPFVEMLDKNADIAVDLSHRVIQSDSRFANKSINWLKQNGGDNPDTAEYLAQMTFVQTEAARVLNNPRLVGQLTDSARHEMQGVVTGDMPVESTERVLRRIKSDGHNRLDAIENENQRLMSGMGSVAAKKSLSPQDQDALDWATAHPGDPRAAKIKAHLGM